MAAMREGRIGFIDTPAQGNTRPDGVTWCADNGCFGKGYPGDDKWIAWLAGQDPAGCLFAVAPDVVGDAAATLERSLPWLPWIRFLGFPAAFVAQDGLSLRDAPWDDFDTLFIGGTTEWKLGPEAAKLVGVAKALDKRVHMGRVNSKRRVDYAYSLGCDSVDGTYLTFGPDKNLPKLLRWMEGLT